MYIMMGTIGASLGSFLMRIELGIPGYVLLENNFHDYNVWITRFYLFKSPVILTFAEIKLVTIDHFNFDFTAINL